MGTTPGRCLRTPRRIPRLVPPVTATDTGTDNLTYTLNGTDAASFDIDVATGWLKTKAALDYETKSSYSVTVTATDPSGASDTITVTIDRHQRG